VTLDLDPDEERALAAELRRIIFDDHYPFSPRIRTLQDILDKLDPPPPRAPLRLPRATPRPRRSDISGISIGYVNACCW
jgi:hypothetical protein